MKVALVLILLAILYTSSAVRFVSYIGQAGPGWGTPGTNEDFLKYIGVPGYGEGSKGYNVLNFAFWVSNSGNGGAAINGAAYDWQNVLSRITSSTLRRTLTGSSSPSSAQLRAGIKAIYEANGIKICISAFGGADHPMTNGASATSTASALATYAKNYNYDCVDIDWEEGIVGKLGSSGGGEAWLCSLTNSLRSQLNSNQQISHAPQAPYFRCSAGDYSCNYPNGGYVTVNSNCGGNIDWYNIQFYNQGSTAYNTYNELFVYSSGWSTNSAVYQIMDKGVPASKIVVGKHTSGDGSTFVSGSTLKSIFSSAISAGRWNAGFMTWQFYREVSYGSSSLIDSVKQVNGWGNSIPTTPTLPTTTTTTTPAPTVSTTKSSTGNIIITNVGSSSGSWFYAASISGVSPGYTVSSVAIRLSSYSWHTCDPPSSTVTWYKCQNLPATISTPLSIRISSGSTVLDGLSVITSFANGQSFDFGKNFGSSGPTPTTTTTPAPTPSQSTPTPPPTTTTPAPTPSQSVPTTTTRAPTPSGGGGTSRIKITNAGGSSAWWYTAILSDIPSGISIDTVKMRAANKASWDTGTYQSWCGCYVFSNDAPYDLPLDFKVTSTKGQSSTSDSLINSFSAGTSGTMQSSLAYNVEDNNNNNSNALEWTVWFAIILCSVCVIGLVIGIYIYYKKTHRGKAYIVDSDLAEKDGDNTTPKQDDSNDDKEILNEQEVEINVEMETQQNNITATAD